MSNDELSFNLQNQRIEQLESIIALMPGNVYWKDKKGRYLGCNRNVAKILKLSTPAEIIGKTNYDLFDKKLADIAAKVDEQVMMTNKELALEEVGLNINGESAIYFTRKVPLRNNNGKVVGLLGISMDMTERKFNEEKLETLKAKLEIVNKVLTTLIASLASNENSAINNILDILNLSKINQYLAANQNKNSYLTKREFICLIYLAKSKTAKEMANILNISPKTVESYIKILRIKLGCYKKSELIEVFFKLAIETS